MAGIAGIVGSGKGESVRRMLNRMAHRGRAGHEVVEMKGTTLGAVWPVGARSPILREHHVACDSVGNGQFAQARANDGTLTLSRDAIGAVPLYYGHHPDGSLCFASEIKGLLETTSDVNELPPGCQYDGQHLTRGDELQVRETITERPEDVARTLWACLDGVVRSRIHQHTMGAWLSGGLDSSAIAALVRPHVRRLYTVAGGVAGSPDLDFARQVADFIRSDHNEVVISLPEMLHALPTVIYHLESFDALLVRSSIINYLVAQRMAELAPDTFSGEGGDELFAGYDYLRSLESRHLAQELVDIIGRLHNTALQRVDRSAAAHGLVVHVPFVNPTLVDYAMRIPVEFKIRDGVEKWILRRAMTDLLPPAVLNRPKAKFWQGAGVGDLLSDYADQHISNQEFRRQRNLHNGWVLNSKEELMYYRIFRDAFGTLENLSWMGRTKGAPRIQEQG
ncbi:MAG TPA: asparagine synthase-related protein [Phycisphaerae bacterium]|nr:asparagine synthase-related protein [Phycisphaerae bacterium]HRY68923.1 asparagine synthase-related protein [Phycisphaerae bacterium]HSA25750.1 asparagine synthase-related protein [Phycisphaerae bacterium]